MVVLNEVTNLRGHFGPIPSHNQHLPNGPAKTALAFQDGLIDGRESVPIEVLEQWVQISVQLDHFEGT